MKILAFSFLSLAGLALIGYQHQQLGRLRAENTSLQQSATEVNQLQADLAKSTGNAAQNEEEISRLREQNHDLLKLRGEVSELRDARAEFEKVSAENKRLQTLTANAPKSEMKQTSMQPIVIQVSSLYDRGLSTPESALQTFFWALHTGNSDALERSLTPESWQRFGKNHPNFGDVVSIEIVARRDLNTITVQLGIQVHSGNSGRDEKGSITLTLQNGEWRVDMKNLN